MNEIFKEAIKRKEQELWENWQSNGDISIFEDLLPLVLSEFDKAEKTMYQKHLENAKLIVEDFMQKFSEKIPKDTCSVCGHTLSSHIDEKSGWRCHSLGPDFYQCECWLRKNRYDDGLNGYDFHKRQDGYLKEDLKLEKFMRETQIVKNQHEKETTV